MAMAKNLNNAMNKTYFEQMGLKSLSALIRLYHTYMPRSRLNIRMPINSWITLISVPAWRESIVSNVCEVEYIRRPNCRTPVF